MIGSWIPHDTDLRRANIGWRGACIWCQFFALLTVRMPEKQFTQAGKACANKKGPVRTICLAFFGNLFIDNEHEQTK